MAAHAARLLGKKEGKTAVLELLDNPCAEGWVEIAAIGHAGRFSDEDADMSLNYLRKTYKSRDASVGIKTECISAAGDMGGLGAKMLLKEIVQSENIDSPFFFEALLGLICLGEEHMEDLTLEFLQKSHEFLQKSKLEDAHIIIASAAWRLNDDRIYDFLINGPAKHREELIANLLLYKTLLKRSDCINMLLQYIDKGSDYLTSVVCGLSQEILRLVPPNNPERKRLVNSLRKQLDDNNISKEQRMIIISSLASDGMDIPNEEVIDYLLALRGLSGEDSMVLPFLINLFGSGSEWPPSSDLHIMLTYSSDSIIFANLYLIGQRKRLEFRDRIRDFLQDDRIIFPAYSEGGYAKHIGNCISDAAKRTNDILTGNCLPKPMPYLVECLSQQS